MTTGASPGVVQVGEISLTNHDGSESVDLSDLFVDMNIYQDLFAPCVTATVSLTDAIALRSRLPIIGDETIRIAYRTPGEEWVTHRLRVYSASPPTRMRDRQLGYVLRCASAPLVLEPTVRVRGYYGPDKISSIVRRVFDEHMVATGLTDRELTIDSTDGLRRFTMTGDGPIKTINRLASEASAGPERSVFLFFEDLYGFRFACLENLSSVPPMETYHLGTQNMVDGGGVGPSQVAASITTTRSVDTMRALASGYLGGTTRWFDPLTKTHGASDYDYSRDFGDTPRPGTGHPVLSTTSGALFGSTGAVERLVVSDDARVHSPYVVAREKPFPRSRADYAARRAAVLFQTTDTIRHTVVVPGWSEHRVGKTIELVIPEYGATDESYNRTSRHESGTYLVTSVNQTITPSRDHHTVLELARSSYASPVTPS